MPQKPLIPHFSPHSKCRILIQTFRLSTPSQMDFHSSFQCVTGVHFLLDNVSPINMFHYLIFELYYCANFFPAWKIRDCSSFFKGKFYPFSDFSNNFCSTSPLLINLFFFFSIVLSGCTALLLQCLFSCACWFLS